MVPGESIEKEIHHQAKAFLLTTNILWNYQVMMKWFACLPWRVEIKGRTNQQGQLLSQDIGWQNKYALVVEWRHVFFLTHSRSSVSINFFEWKHTFCSLTFYWILKKYTLECRFTCWMLSRTMQSSMVQWLLNSVHYSPITCRQI